MESSPFETNSNNVVLIGDIIGERYKILRLIGKGESLLLLSCGYYLLFFLLTPWIYHVFVTSVLFLGAFGDVYEGIDLRLFFSMLNSS